MRFCELLICLIMYKILWAFSLFSYIWDLPPHTLGVGAKAGIQISKRKFHTYIHID